MKIQFLFLVLCFAFAPQVLYAQSNTQTPNPEPTPSCPMVNVSCPDSAAVAEPLTFTANVSRGDPNVISTFNWTISAGKISSGQGTSSITVETENLKEGDSITATVEIGGFDRSCQNSNSCSASIIKRVEVTEPTEVTNQQKLKIFHKIWNYKIIFNKGKETISPESMRNIPIIADLFKQLPSNIAMEIGSYTDDVGRRSLNLTLSQRRAEFLKNEFIKLGISEVRLQAMGYGNAKSNANNSPAVAVQYVEFKFIG